MRILYCASEANPFCGSGGLADVAGSLPHTLCRKGQDCRIVVPLYGTIPQELKNSMNFITNFTVPVAWRHQYCGLFWARWNDCTYYFIDNEYYFKRGTLYGHYDDAERFAFFSRAILEMLPYIDFHPDIIHCNDWQTALVPVYYYLFYSHRPWYYNIKSLFTIHNIQYQGEYGWEVNTECVGIPASETKILEMNGKLSKHQLVFQLFLQAMRLKLKTRGSVGDFMTNSIFVTTSFAVSRTVLTQKATIPKQTISFIATIQRTI